MYLFTLKRISILLVSMTLLLASKGVYAQAMPYPQFVDTGHPQEDSASYKAAVAKYQEWKSSQIQFKSLAPGNAISSGSNFTQAAAANCIIPRDASWTEVPTNDDGFIGPINLGFTFNLYGSNYTQVYINTNGNLTFTQGYSPYTPSGFPFGVPMVAAFWADEDTRPRCGGTGVIYYKREATRLLVTWENVGYYELHCDRTVTFQIVIGTQSDPVISATGAGNNVLFNYGDMNWTTGDASGGVGGFGGSPATVGVNKGNGINYVQVGRFDKPGMSYDGGGGANDGVDYLDDRCFSFNVGDTLNIPPSFSGQPSGNTINVQVGQTANYTIQAIGPEVNQTVTTTLNTGGLCGVTSTITNGAISTTNLSVTGMACNVGSRTIVLTATDNGSPVQTNTLTLTINVANPNLFYSKPIGDLNNLTTWGNNADGSGVNPPDFGAGRTFILANRSSGYALTANWTVGGILSIPSGSLLQIGSYTLSIADLTGTGTLGGSTASNLIVNQPSAGGTSLNFAAGSNNLNNLGIASAATTTLASSLNISGVLTVQSGTFNTGNVLTLRSTAANTARVAPVTGTITGTVTVERYIPARRAWRIMSAPVGGSQSINAAWQEGVTTFSANPNPNPGYGTHITEGNAAAGLDHNPLTAMTSVKRYISASDTWTPLANTNAAAVNADAYLLFVRGNRGIALGDSSVAPNNTTLRATGPLKTGDQTFPVSAAGFTAIPNPFASPINFATITRTNVQNNFYLWDPKMGGEYGVGAYVLLSYNGSTYDVIPASVSPESQYIQSGQGFIVRSTGTAGSLVIKEADKSATAAMDVFRAGGSNRSGNGTPFADVPVSSSTPGLRVNLQAINKDNTTSLLDEVFSSYGNSFSDKVDNMDAQKIPNAEENLAIIRENSMLMVDRSKALEESDKIQLKLWNTSSAKQYLLEFNPVGITASVSAAYLKDNYLKTTTPIDLHKVSQLYFSVNADAASADPSRFTVAFKAGSDALPISGKHGIMIYPNPLNGKSIRVWFNEQAQGTYKVELVNSSGQVVHRAQITHGGGSAIKQLELASKPARGVYLLNITNPTTKTTLKIVVD